MIDADLVLIVLLVEAAVALAAALLLVLHGVTLNVFRARRTRLSARARDLLLQSLEAPRSDPAAAAAVRELPAGLRVDVLADVGGQLIGRARDRVGDVASASGTLSRAARLTHSRRWRSRLRGARLFTTLGGGAEHLPRLLSDPRPEVLAQAVEWSADHALPGNVERLLDLLVTGDALARYAVRDALQRLGPAAVGPVRERLRQATGTEAARLLPVARTLASVSMLGDGLRLAIDQLPETRAGAASLLAGLGGEAATLALETMLADDDARVRAAAARGLGRLGGWESGTPLAACLGDPSWDVRLASALSLRALGAPGLVLLRRGLQSDDAFARDIARQVLDLPEGAEPFLP